MKLKEHIKKFFTFTKEAMKILWFCFHLCPEDEPCKRKVRFKKVTMCEDCAQSLLAYVWGVNSFKDTDRIVDEREEE